MTNMYKDKWAHTQPMAPKSTLRRMRTLRPSLASLAQSIWSLLSNDLAGQDCIKCCVEFFAGLYSHRYSSTSFISQICSLASFEFLLLWFLKAHSIYMYVFHYFFPREDSLFFCFVLFQFIQLISFMTCIIYQVYITVYRLQH